MGKKWLSQREIWDDSSLQRSWNAAQAEYQKYHSIHNSGENVEDLLQQIEAEEAGQAENAAHEEPSEVDDMHTKLEDNVSGSARDGAANGDQSTDIEVRSKQSDAMMTNARSPPPQLPDRAAPAFQSSGQSAMPTGLLGSVQDEALRNVMLSWYYAGYYTGIYEGKQNATSNIQHQREASEDQRANEPFNF